MLLHFVLMIHATAQPPADPTPIQRDEVLPKPVEEGSLNAAIHDAARDLPLRVMVEECTLAAAVSVVVEADTSLTSDQVLERILDAYTAAGGSMAFDTAEVVRNGQPWPLLQEQGCSTYALDQRLDVTWEGTNLEDGLNAWSAALSEALGEEVYTRRPLRTGAETEVTLSAGLTARASLQRLLDAVESEDTAYGWYVYEIDVPDKGWTTFVSWFPVRVAPRTSGTRDGPVRRHDGQKFPIEPEVPPREPNWGTRVPPVTLEGPDE
jgi:hypothetical protein